MEAQASGDLRQRCSDFTPVKFQQFVDFGLVAHLGFIFLHMYIEYMFTNIIVIYIIVRVLVSEVMTPSAASFPLIL